LAIAAAKRISDTDLREGETRAPWIVARDAAVLALLYGSGLRISEALSLKRKGFDASDAITVTGKGNKSRMVPMLPQVATSITGYIALCPLDLPDDGPYARGPSLQTTGAAILSRMPNSSGRMRVDLLARDCPSHAEEVSRRLAQER